MKKQHKFMLAPHAAAIGAALCCGMLFADGPNNYQGPNDGDWSADANWSQGHEPRPDEDVGIAGVTVNAPGMINVMSLHLLEATLCIGDKTSRPHVAPVVNGDLELAQGSKLYVYAGELMNYDVFETEEKAMAAIRAAANIVTIGGDFIVDDTSVVYPECGEFTGVPVIFKVGGEFTLVEGASFNVTRCGWAWSNGPWADRPSTYCKRRMAENTARDEGWTVAFGAGLNYNTGGRYGGNAAGTKWSDWTYGKSYGPTFAPIFPGSPGGMYISPLNSERGRGPGSIVVLTTGAATINGVMDADGTKHVKGELYEHSATSGGGIWLAASEFTFGPNAKLTAEGGTLTLGYGLAWRLEGGNNYFIDSVARMTGHARLVVGGDLALGGNGRVVVRGGPVEGDYTFATGTSFLAVGGGLSLADTSVLGLYSDPMSGGSVKVTADSFTVAETAKVDALGRGYAWLNSTPPDAPGLGYSYTVGGSHGGQGGGNSASSKYDFELAPVMPGSPNGSYSSNQRPAGGVIRVHARTMSIEGTLTVDSVTSTWTTGSVPSSSSTVRFTA